MLTKTIKYTNFNDEEKELVAHFHLGKADLARIAANPEFLEVMNRAAKDQDTKMMLAKIEELVRMSYGVRSADGERFVKSQEVQDAFIQSAAYEEFLLDLLAGDGTSFNNFIKGVFPPKLMEMLTKQIKEGKVVDPFKDVPNPESNKGIPAEPTYEEQAKAQDARPAYVRENRVPTPEELQDMTDDDLRLAARWTPGDVWPPQA